MYKVSQQYLHPHEPNLLGYVPSDAPNIVGREGSSFLRELLADHVCDNNLSCPIPMITKSVLEKQRQALYESS
jgi:hypothetical protein